MSSACVAWIVGAVAGFLIAETEADLFFGTSFAARDWVF